MRHAEKFQGWQISAGDVTVELALPFLESPVVRKFLVESREIWIGDIGKRNFVRNRYNKFLGEGVARRRQIGGSVVLAI
jgi:hypothetical protein